jgi:formate-dependent nitrite reductase membrane component NrfD
VENRPVPESRFDDLRDEAARTGTVRAAGAGSEGTAADTYYDQPVLKAPVWTWEVPLYFVVGGAAGTASVVALLSALAGGDAALARDARVIAVAGALISPLLLISDLGRPSRFLNMLRVLKPQSAMSVGAWTLVAFQASAGAALALHLWPSAVGPLTPALAMTADAVAACAGLVLATYTGVLLSVTAIPVWASHARLLPVHFGASSLGVTAALLELAGHHTPMTHRLAIGAAVIVWATSLLSERHRTRAAAPLRTGRSGMLVRTGDALAGPVVLVLRLAWMFVPLPALRLLAAASAIAGSVLTRYGWIAAGRASAADPRVILDPDSP